MSTWSRRLRDSAAAISIAAAVAAALPVGAAEEPVVVRASVEHPAAGKRASREENIGVATGVVVGAFAGGPIGAMVGGAAGAWLGDRYHKQKVQSAALTQDLADSETQRNQLAQNIETLNGSLQSERGDRSKLAQALAQARDLATDVSFRTDDATVGEDATARLKKLAVFAQAVPGLQVRVCGRADPRGSEQYNQALSEKRAQAVASVLSEAGIGADRLIVEARGAQDSVSVAGDLDGFALDRRVTVTLEGTGDGALALAR
jgi:outer membrane protein OmpA-like peptidoglycan-associated protein